MSVGPWCTFWRCFLKPTLQTILCFEVCCRSCYRVLRQGVCLALVAPPRYVSLTSCCHCKRLRDNTEAASHINCPSRGVSEGLAVWPSLYFDISPVLSAIDLRPRLISLPTGQLEAGYILGVTAHWQGVGQGATLSLILDTPTEGPCPRRRQRSTDLRGIIAAEDYREGARD